MEKAKNILTGLSPVLDKIMDEVNTRYLSNTNYDMIIGGGSALKYYVRGFAYQMLKQNSLLLSFDHDYKVQQGYEQVFAENMILSLRSIINSTVKESISYQGFMLLLAIRSTFGNQANFHIKDLFTLRLVREIKQKNDSKTLKLYNIFLNIQINSSNVESIPFIDISTLDARKMNRTMYFKLDDMNQNILTLNNYIINQLQSLQNSQIRTKTKTVKVLFRIAFLKACWETNMKAKSFVPLRFSDIQYLLKYNDKFADIEDGTLIAHNQKIFTDISFPNNKTEALFQTFLYTIKSVLENEETSVIIEELLNNNNYDESLYEEISNTHKDSLNRQEIQSVFLYSKSYKLFIIALLYMNVLNDDTMMNRTTDDYGNNLNGFQNYHEWYGTLNRAFLTCSSMNVLHPEFTVYTGLKMYEFPNDNFTHFSTSNAPLPFIIPFNTLVSTSVSRQVAHGFMGTHCCLLQITIPREYTSFIYMGNRSMSSYVNEKEVLLHPDTLFIVTGREYVYNYDKQKTILVLKGIIQEKSKKIDFSPLFDPYNNLYQNNNSNNNINAYSSKTHSFKSAKSTFDKNNNSTLRQTGGDPATSNKINNSKKENHSNNPMDILFEQVNTTKMSSQMVKMLMNNFYTSTENDKDTSTSEMQQKLTSELICLPKLSCIDLSVFEDDDEAKTSFLNKYYEKLLGRNPKPSFSEPILNTSLSKKSNKSVISPKTPSL